MLSCLKYNPSYPSAHYITAECYKEINEVEKLNLALNIYDQGLKLFPEHADS